MGVPVPSDALPTPSSPTDPDIVQVPVETTVGASFVISEAKINEGWSLEPNPLGLAIENMTADSPGKSLDGLPVMFDLVFLDGETELDSTFCTLGEGSAPIKVICLPVSEDAGKATKVRATTF